MKKFIFILFACISLQSHACPDLLDNEMRVLDSSNTQNLCEYEDNVILVVNVASRCGYTYQYEGLQSLYDNYKDSGLVVIGIPSRDFMQEYKNESDVAEFCSTEFGVDFPMYATTKVRGKKAHPFYKKLKKETGREPSWNFNKFLISRDANKVIYFDKKVKPESKELVQKIEYFLES